MDSEKKNKENCGLHVDDGKQYETFDLERESQPSRATLDKKEAAERDVNGHLSIQEKEPEGLESVQKYASRIKSFLGWETSEEEQKNEKESRITSSLDVVDGNRNAAGSPGDSANEEKECGSLEEGENSGNVTKHRDLSIQVVDAKPNSLLLTGPIDDCDLTGDPSNSKTVEIENEDMNPEVRDAISSPNSSDKISVDNVDHTSSELVPSNNKSDPDNSRGGNANQETEVMTEPDLNTFASPITVHGIQTNEVQENESETYDTNAKKDSITDEKENEQTPMPDLETGVSNEKEVFKTDSLNSHSDQMVCSEGVEKTEIRENGSCGENFSEAVENRDDIHLYDNVPEQNNPKKTYIDGIRRLSIDIVKDVIESARNSVHEIFANKNELETMDETADDSDTTPVSNGNKFSDIGSTENKQNIAHQFLGNEPRIPSMHNEFNESKDNIIFTKELVNHTEGSIDEEIICGFGSCHPKWIQKYATSRMFLFFFSAVGIINGTYYAYFVSIISTLEKRYAFKTKVSGTLLMADEITPLIFGVIVGYLGGRTHRPRMVTLGMLCSTACCFISAFPYLIYGSAKHLTVRSTQNATDPDLCIIGENRETCSIDDRPPTVTVVVIFILASFLKGIATLSYYVIGISYMDDNIRKKNTPLYLAVALALRLLGPLVGFIMSSAFLKIYENPFDDPGFGPEDPRWIGAWWMGFFLQGVLLLIFTLPIALFPRRLPNQRKVEKSSYETNKENVKETLSGLVSALKRLGKNPIFIVLIVNTTMKIFGHFGHTIMLPKYMENQFRLSAADASLFSGATSIFCVMISTVVGGFLIWKYRPRIKLLVGGMIASEIILCLGFLVLMIPRCEPSDMQHFGMNDEGLILDSVCNQNCDCSTTSFTPFCGADGKTTYFSPCFAGCTQELTTQKSPKEKAIFGNCSCVSGTNTSDLNSETIIEGFCPDESCWSKALAYLIILFILLTVSNTLTVAHTMILLRSVHPGDKSIALGTFETFICLFGFIPFPVTYGALVDSACLVWEESCGETGNCWFYDMEKFGYLLHGTSAIFCSLSTVCLITLYCLSSRVRDLYVEDDEEERIDNIKLDTVSGSVTKL